MAVVAIRMTVPVPVVFGAAFAFDKIPQNLYYP